jgi:hydrogenase/urease accessory protein HupE
MRVALFLALSALAAPSLAAAHDTSPGILAIEERADGMRAVWTAPVDTRAADDGRVRPVFPDECTMTGTSLTCEHGIPRSVRIDGLDGTRIRVVVSLRRADGTSREAIATAEAPSVSLAGDGRDLGGWVRLGIEHVLLGLDHLAFLLGLLLVAQLDRRVLLTVTAFTLAHSLTLALSVLDVVRVASAPVEAAIAASVLLVARESLHERPTLTRRAPWIVAGVFGLVHGLGFASALREIGVPSGSVVPALVGFNVGVELGQLAVVLVVVIAARLLRDRARVWPKARIGAAYLLGSAAGFWVIARTLAIVSGS